MIKLARAAIVLMLGCGSHAAVDADAGSTSTTVPIVVHDKFTAGVPGMFIPVQVGSGSATAQLILDTGSSGLRILASAIGSDSYHRTGTMLSNTFDNGMVFDGEEATAIVTVGD